MSGKEKRISGMPAVVAGILFISSGTVFGQALSGTLVGTVSDDSGAAIAGAVVTLRNNATAFSRTVSTNSSGQFVAPSIPTGIYSASAEKSGFGKLVRDGIELTAA